MVALTLPDGSVRKFDGPVTGQTVAADIGPGLAKAALAVRVDGVMWDLSRAIEADAEFSVVTAKDEDALKLLRHDAAHVMAQAVQELFPGTQVTIGPAVDNGFYYDFARDEPFSLDDLEKIEKPAGISNPKDFRNEVVNFVLRARAQNAGKNPSWTSYEKLRAVIEKKMFSNTEDLLPVISFMGPAVAGLIAGSFVIETIFNIPGLGQDFVKSAFNRDYTLVLGVVMFYATLIIFLNLIVDILQVTLNPKLKFD